MPRCARVSPVRSLAKTSVKNGRGKNPSAVIATPVYSFNIYLFVCESKTFKLDLAVLLVHWEPGDSRVDRVEYEDSPVEVHVASHVEVDPAGVSDCAVVVDPEGGRLGVVGRDADRFRLNKN